MNREDKIKKLDLLKIKASTLKKEVDYYNAFQLALKLVLNGSYGAFATPYFILYNNHVAGTITAQGRELTQTMDKCNQDYWYNQWHLDYDLHKKLNIDNVTIIKENEPVSIYGDTDSIFVSFKPAMNNCNWKNIFLNSDYLNNIDKRCFILTDRKDLKYNNHNILKLIDNVDELKNYLNSKFDILIIDGNYVKNRDLKELISSYNITFDILWNWSNERDFIQGVDEFRYSDFFKQKLDEHAERYGVDNKQDFELERISESIINIAKKKYIQHIVHEDGIDYDRLNYIFPKGVELVRSSTPAFAREKIVDIVKYLFSHPDNFNIKDLLKLVKKLRKEFELANIDDICMQSSVSNYENKVLDDTKLPLNFVKGSHFAVKSAAYHNYLLNANKKYQNKYEYIKSGTKIKYYVCKDKSINDMFAYIRGSFPIEIAPEIDYDSQFEKSILSPINSIIEPLGIPKITKRLSVVMDIFGGF